MAEQCGEAVVYGCLSSRFQNVHPNDQSILEATAVANARVGDELSGSRIVDHLMDIDVMLPPGSSVKPSG
jgi:hypothetical protein